MKRILLISTLILGSFCAGAQERLHFNIEWGYTNQIYSFHHYNIQTPEGYRFSDTDKGFVSNPNADVRLGIGFNISDKFDLMLMGGYEGIARGRRVTPAMLRLSYFYNRAFHDGFYSFAEGGLAVDLQEGFKRNLCFPLGIGEGYRLQLGGPFSLDLLLSLRCCPDKPPIENPEGTGFVPKESIRLNKARYYSVNLSVSFNF